jgi:hypothetical protein
MLQGSPLKTAISMESGLAASRKRGIAPCFSGPEGDELLLALRELRE